MARLDRFKVDRSVAVVYLLDLRLITKNAPDLVRVDAVRFVVCRGA